MMDDSSAYAALASRDPRFDGVFFTGVISTGIYCRPICPAKTPLRKNCRFFARAETAEKEGFRPCLRCRPELAPGLAPVDQAGRLAQLFIQRMDEGLLDESGGLEEVAAQFGISSRQLRRVLQRELGLSPIEWMQSRRLLLAKQLLTETKLPVTEIAFASGFSSLRRFNDAFLSRYRMPPTRLRKKAALASDSREREESPTLLLCYRPPYAWEGMLDFLAARIIEGVEEVSEGYYRRTVRLGRQVGWIEVGDEPEKGALKVRFSPSLVPVLPVVLGRLKQLFDLSAVPAQIGAQLSRDPLLKKLLRKNPGLRVPGAFEAFELVWRAVLGQQITVKAATLLAGRLAVNFGDRVKTPFASLNRLTPEAERLVKAGAEDIGRLGIVRVRAQLLVELAKGFRSGVLRVEAGGEVESVMEKLLAYKGIGPWTANYIALRGLRWPDAFPREDVALRRALGGITAREAEERSLAWRPWRSYAVMHLWRSLGRGNDEG